jgi:hypothetical protein
MNILSSSARYFETYFPEAFQQLGAMILGHFLELGNPQGFTWIRGFHDMPARATVNKDFYDGPVWKEHGPTMNARLIDHTNVLLLKPLRAGLGIPVLPAVDPIHEPNGAEGLAIAQILAVKSNAVDDFWKRSATIFERYCSLGIHQAGVLVTLDAPNNFPRLPFRTDGTYLVWLGIARDEPTWETQLKPILLDSANPLVATGLLRSKPELVSLRPSHRSRLRWLPS